MDLEVIKNFISNIDFAMIGMIVTAVVCVFIILIHILRAKKHGLAFTIGTFLILLISIALAVIGSRILALLLGDQLLALIKTLNPDTYEQILSWVPSATNAGPAVFAMLIGPLLMPILFIVFRAVLQIFAKLIRKIFARPVNRYEYGEDPAQAEKRAAKEQAKKEKAEKAAAEKAEKAKAKEEAASAQADSADQTAKTTGEAPEDAPKESEPANEETASSETAEGTAEETVEEASSPAEEKPAEAKPDAPSGEPAIAPAREPLNTQPVKRRRNPIALALALILGAVCGCMVVVVLFSSAIGYQIVMSNLFVGLDKAAEEASQGISASENPESGNSSADQGMTIIKDLTETAKSITSINVIDRTIFSCGGQVLFNLTSTYEYDGNRLRLMSESDVLGNVIRDASVFLNVDTSSDRFTLTTDHANAIKDVVRDMGASELVPPIVANIVARASTEWSQGKPFNNISLPDLGETIQPSAYVVFGKLSETTKTTLNEDLMTIADVLYVLIDKGVFNDPENITSILSKMGESGCLDDIFDILEQNERMRVLVIEVENIALRSMSSMLGIRENREEIYSVLIRDLVESYNQLNSVSDDSVVGFGKTVKEKFQHAGLPMTDSMADTLAVSMLVEFGTNNITESDMEAFFRSFGDDSGTSSDLKGNAEYVLLSDETTDGQNNRVVGRGTEWIKDMTAALTQKNQDRISFLLDEAEALFGYSLEQISENILTNAQKDDNSDASGFVSNLQAAGSIQPVLTTIQDLMHSPEQFSESRAFSIFMVSSAKDLMDMMNEDNQSSNSDTRKMLASVGKTIDDLKKNGYDHPEELLLALIESDTMTEGIGMNPIETKSVGDKVNEEVRRSQVGYEILLPNMYDVVTAMMSIGDTAATKEETLENIQNMVSNLTPETARALAGIAETDLLSNIGIPEDSMEGTTAVVSNLLNNLADAKETGMSDDQVQSETDSINSLMQVAMSSVNTSADTMFGDDSKTSMTADEFLTNVFGSEIVSNTIASSIVDDNGEPVNDPLNIGSAFTDNDIALLMQAEDEGGYSDEQIQMLHTFLGIQPTQVEP